jgi:hypothetical protein
MYYSVLNLEKPSFLAYWPIFAALQGGRDWPIIKNQKQKKEKRMITFTVAIIFGAIGIATGKKFDKEEFWAVLAMAICSLIVFFTLASFAPWQLMYTVMRSAFVCFAVLTFGIVCGRLVFKT